MAGAETETGRDLDSLLAQVTEAFLIPPDSTELLQPLDQLLSSLPPPYEEIGRAFRANLESLFSTVTMPYELAAVSALDGKFQGISIAARIRARSIEAEEGETPEQLEARRDKLAHDRTLEAMEKFMASSEGQDAVLRDSCWFLFRAMARQPSAHAASELLLQGVVLCWGALEVLARDCFVAALNRNPERVITLMRDPVAKRRFELAKVSIELLSAHAFDLSDKMGTVLAEQQDFSDFVSIKSVYEALFPDVASLRSALANEDLRLLSLRRHLVVHRRGIVDDAYRQKAKSPQSVGERLTISPQILETHFRTCVNTGAEILGAAAGWQHDVRPSG